MRARWLPPALARFAAGGAPPGAPPGMPPPRLPSIGGVQASAQPYAPPPPPPTQTISGDPGLDSEVALQPVQLLSGGLAKAYTTTRRWKGIDVYLDTAGISFGLLGSQHLIVSLFTIAKGVRTLVATGRMSFVEFSAGWRTKHMIAYRGGAAERFEVDFGTDFIPADPTATMQLAIMATDEVVDVDSADCDEVGTVCRDCTNGGGEAQVIALTSTLGGSLELRGVVAVSAPGVAAATPRWLHVHDFIGALGGLVPLFSYGLTDGGGLFADPKFVSHRFGLAIRAVISTTALVTTLIGAEDSGASTLIYR